MPGQGRRGRPPKPKADSKTENFSTRITSDLREKIDRAAAKNGNSVSKEVALRLGRSFEFDRREQVLVKNLGGPQTYGLLLTIYGLINSVEGMVGAAWHSNSYAADVAKRAVLIAFDHLSPQPQPGETPDLPDHLPQYWRDGHYEIDGKRYEFDPAVAIALGVIDGIRAAGKPEDTYAKTENGRTIDYSDQIKLYAAIKEHLGDVAARLEKPK